MTSDQGVDLHAVGGLVETETAPGLALDRAPAQFRSGGFHNPVRRRGTVEAPAKESLYPVRATPLVRRRALPRRSVCPDSGLRGRTPEAALTAPERPAEEELRAVRQRDPLGHAVQVLGRVSFRVERDAIARLIRVAHDRVAVRAKVSVSVTAMFSGRERVGLPVEIEASSVPSTCAVHRDRERTDVGPRRSSFVSLIGVMTGASGFLAAPDTPTKTLGEHHRRDGRRL